MKDAQKKYDLLIQTNSKIERKGKAMPYTSVNGHMFSFLSQEGKMGLRLSREDREHFIENYDAKLMEQHGRVMKEYVTVPDMLLNDTEQLSVYLEKSFNYVSNLKPKTTKNNK